MMQLTGLDNVLRNLNKEIKQIRGRSVKGLIRAAIIIRRDMDKTPPLVPVDTGNLRASWFTIASAVPTAAPPPTFRKSKRGGAAPEAMVERHEEVLGEARSMMVDSPVAFVVIGFSAAYAWFVHEHVGANFKRPGAGAKFFEAAIKRNQGQILDVIRREVNLK